MTIDSARSEQARVQDPAVSSEDARILATDNAAFAFATYSLLKQGDGDLVFSPISLSVALAMTYAGAAGTTASGMATALRFSLPPERLHPAFDALGLQLAARGEGAQDTKGGPLRLRMVNATWVQQDYVLLPGFLDTLALYYGAGVNLLDFRQAPDPSRRSINAWVADATDDTIRDLLPPDSISPATVLVLTNAIDFNAAWKHPFPPEGTLDRPFTLLDGGQVTVKMMKDAGRIRGLATANLKAIVLPYQDERLSLLLVVPEPGAFAQVEASMDASWLEGILAGLGEHDAFYQIPRFSLRTNALVKEALIALGMRAAFEAGVADFSGIDGTRQLYIQDLFHQAFITVGEKGTEAAAATAVVMAGGSPELSLVADRPFFYFLRDEPTGAILFMGRVLNPSR